MGKWNPNPNIGGKEIKKNKKTNPNSNCNWSNWCETQILILIEMRKSNPNPNRGRKEITEKKKNPNFNHNRSNWWENKILIQIRVGKK